LADVQDKIIRWKIIHLKNYRFFQNLQLDVAEKAPLRQKKRKVIGYPATDNGLNNVFNRLLAYRLCDETDKKIHHRKARHFEFSV
jgi:hypothetical protein